MNKGRKRRASTRWMAGLAAIVFSGALTAIQVDTALAQAQATKPTATAKPKPRAPQRMNISAYSLEGRTLLSIEEFSKIVEPYTGPQKAPKDIEAARRAVQQAYRDLGYCGMRVNLAAPRPRNAVMPLRLAAVAYKKTPDCLPAAKLDQRAKSAVIVSVKPMPVVVAKPAPVVEEKPKPAPVAPAPEPAAFVPPPRFDITRFETVGGTLLTAEQMEKVLGPYTGKNKDFSDIQRALEALEDAHRSLGYGVVQVVLPEQDITRGVVQFRVLQARVGKVVVE